MPPRYRANPLGALLLTALLLLAPAAAAQDGQAFWTDVDSQQIEPVSDRGVEPLVYRALALDFEGIAAHLAHAPLEQTPGRIQDGLLVTLPLPDGSFATYRVVESPVMQPGLQSRYPQIRTYLGVDVQVPSATVRLSVTPQGFHAMSQRPEGTVFIDPYTQFDLHHVKAYRRADMPPRDPHLHPPDEVIEFDDIDLGDDGGGLRFDHGETLRIYRIAIAANRHYTGFHSVNEPTVAEGLAAIVVAMNRVNGIYEREITVRMVLVDNNDLIIYTNAADDPYTNTPSGTNITTNHNNITSVIGSANFDIGHLFITGGGGLAGVGVVCNNFNKGRAVTGLPQPINDPFYVDYVSHEIGHQFGARHTFNGSAGGCGPGQYHAPESMEPGSGSTIMAYSGLCLGHNIQTRSDDYLHNISLQRMIAFITTGGGSACPQEVATDNNIPVPIMPEAFSIPILTPFALTGGAEYAGDESALTFGWEGMSTSSQGPPPGAAGWDDSPPYFRSFPATESPTRFFPTRLDRFMVDPGPGPPPFRGEGLPESTGILTFRQTVRNNAPGGGAVSHRQMTISVAGSRGPFVVTALDEPETLLGLQQVTLTWDVADTNVSSLGGENVDILLSLDRSSDLFDGTAIVLAEGIPNDGAATVTVPAGLSATRARFIVRASEGYFFSFNAADLTILPEVSADDGPRTEAAYLSAVYPNPLGVSGARGTINLQVEQAQTVRVVVFDALGREVLVLHDGPVAAGVSQTFSFNARQYAAGVYYVRATGESFSLARPVTIVH